MSSIIQSERQSIISQKITDKTGLHSSLVQGFREGLKCQGTLSYAITKLIR
jgi:hypothetical protein